MAITTPSVIRVTINPNLKFASGSIVSAVNVGTGEGAVLQSSSGGALSLRTIKAGNYIEVINGTTEITINASGTVPDTRTINSYPLTTDIVLTKSDLVLDQVDNTSDLNKPLSSASITALATKVDSNAAITAGTFTKVTIDSKGLVTLGTGALTSDINDSIDKRYVTDANLIVIGNTANTNTGDETQSTIKQKLGSASISQDGYLTKEDYQTFLSFSSGSSSGANLGSGSTLYKETINNTLYFKTIQAGINTSIQEVDNTLIINSSGGISSVNWGQITGSIVNQTDLYNELTALSGSIVTESLNRINADINLQNQITNISGSVEYISNKSTNINLGTSDTLYPSQNAVKVYVDTNISASSSITTASNLGTGLGLYSGSVGNNLQFKSLKAGNNITLSSSSTEITINSTASGSTSGSVDYSYILPYFNGIRLLSSSSVFTASDLGITMFEDCSVIKAHNGLYYMFLDDLTGSVNKDVYCVSSASPLFTSPTFIGKVITKNNSRCGGITYDPINEEYILYVSNFVSPYEIHAYYISQNDFPSGTWTDAGVILSTGSAGRKDDVYLASMTNAIRNKSGMYMIYYSSSDRLVAGRPYWGNLAFSQNPRGVFSKFPGNPIFQERPTDIVVNTLISGNNIHPRGILPVTNGYVVFYEGYGSSGNYWQVGAVYMDSSFRFGHEIQGSPFFIADNQTFCNPDSVIADFTNKKMYVYYQSSSVGSPFEINNQHVAEFLLLTEA